MSILTFIVEPPQTTDFELAVKNIGLSYSKLRMNTDSEVIENSRELTKVTLTPLNLIRSHASRELRIVIAATLPRTSTN